MGQLASRQATPTKSSSLKSSTHPRRHHAESERFSHARNVDGEPPPKSVHWARSATRTVNRTGARGSTTHPNALKEVDGNIGVSIRQPKYGRSKTAEKPARTKRDRHQFVRKPETPPAQTKSKAKAHYHNNKSHASRSSRHRKDSHKTKECIVCTDTRPLHRFPNRPPTEACAHDPDVCRRCLRTWIESEFSIKIWNEINCPICAARMKHADIHDFAPKDVSKR